MSHLPRQLACIIAAFFILAPQIAFAAPTQAHLRAGEHGQALLLSRLGECYAITPEHVIAGELFATLIGGTAEAPTGDADLLQTFGYDLSILRASGAVTRHCGGSLTDAPPLDGLLSRATAGVVSSVNSDGSISRRTVTLSDVGLVYLRIRPRSPDDQLFKGLSGSLVLVDKEPVGILMSVDPETGVGRALRYDRAVEVLRPFFGLSAGSAHPEAEAETSPALTAGSSGEVVSWSSPPLGAEYRAANLLDGATGGAVWLAQAGDFPVELVIDLPGEEAQVVDGLRLIGAGVEPAERLLRDFEVLISSTREGGWIPVSSGTYFKNDAEKSVRFMPVRARRIMLRIYSHWGAGDAVGLAEIAVSVPR